jgi:putative hydrolase of the HAD superfamily
MTAVYVEDEDDRKLVSEVVFDRLYWDRLDAGTITDDEVLAGVCSSLPKRLHNSAKLVYVNWIVNIPFIDGMTELILKLKKEGRKLYLLSNISKGFALGYKNVPELAKLFSHFDGLVFSGPIGILKPGKEIFEYLLKKYDVDRTDCIFVDDSEKNIIGAESAGIEGYLFDGDSEKLNLFLHK